MPSHPKYKLTYFNIRGLAEPIRFVFAYVDVPFEDFRVAGEEWEKIKPNMPWKSVPILEVDGKILAQSKAILRFLGKKYNLCGLDEWQGAKCDEIMDAMTDVQLACRPLFLEPDEAKKAELKKKLIAETFPENMKRLNAMLKENGGITLVGDGLTIADFVVAHHLYQSEQHVDPNVCKDFPALKALQGKVFSSPGIKEWIAKRPETKI